MTLHISLTDSSDTQCDHITTFPDDPPRILERLSKTQCNHITTFPRWPPTYPWPILLKPIVNLLNVNIQLQPSLSFQMTLHISLTDSSETHCESSECEYPALTLTQLPWPHPFPLLPTIALHVSYQVSLVSKYAPTRFWCSRTQNPVVIHLHYSPVFNPRRAFGHPSVLLIFFLVPTSTYFTLRKRLLLRRPTNFLLPPWGRPSWWRWPEALRSSCWQGRPSRDPGKSGRRRVCPGGENHGLEPHCWLAEGSHGCSVVLTPWSACPWPLAPLLTCWRRSWLVCDPYSLVSFPVLL